MSYQQEQQHRPELDDNGSLYCRICAENGYPEQAVRRLHNGREMIIVDHDTGHKHYHIFDAERYWWDHYEDNLQISRWPEHAKLNS
jgi:hypothetical protein